MTKTNAALLTLYKRSTQTLLYLHPGKLSQLVFVSLPLSCSFLMPGRPLPLSHLQSLANNTFLGFLWKTSASDSCHIYRVHSPSVNQSSMIQKNGLFLYTLWHILFQLSIPQIRKKINKASGSSLVILPDCKLLTGILILPDKFILGLILSNRSPKVENTLNWKDLH